MVIELPQKRILRHWKDAHASLCRSDLYEYPRIVEPSFKTTHTISCRDQIYGEDGLFHLDPLRFLDRVSLNPLEDYAFAEWHVHPTLMDAHETTVMNSFPQEVAAHTVGALIVHRSHERAMDYQCIVVDARVIPLKFIREEEAPWLAITLPRSSEGRKRGVALYAYGVHDEVRGKGWVIVTSTHKETKEPLLF